VANFLLSVEAAAERLQLHPKTVLRFIREGRLAAVKVGKAYRIQRADVDALAGIAPSAGFVEARVTAVVDVPDVDAELLRRLTATLMAAGGSGTNRGAALSLDVAHDPLRRTVKVILVGAPRDVAVVLQITADCVEA
jgi:excisionase family DNA binding protein